MIIGNKPTNPGELRTPVTLLKRTIFTDAGGFQAQSVETIAAAWARWENVHGSEAWAASAVATEAATVLIRYRAGLDETCLVRMDGTIYEVVSMDDIQQRHEYLELKVKRAAEA